MYVLVERTAEGSCVYQRFGDDLYLGHGVKSDGTVSDGVEDRDTWFTKLSPLTPETTEARGLFAVKPGRLAVSEKLASTLEAVVIAKGRGEGHRPSIQLAYDNSGILRDMASFSPQDYTGVSVEEEEKERAEFQDKLQSVSGQLCNFTV